MIVNYMDRWKLLLDKLKESRDPQTGDFVISADTETLDHGFPDVKLVGMSFGWYDKQGTEHAAYVPFNHAQDGERISGQLGVAEIRPDLRELFGNPNRTVVFHNAKYDVKVLDRYDIPMEAFLYDTMVAGFLLDTTGAGSKKMKMFDNGRFGLSYMIEHLFDYEMAHLKDFCESEPKYPGTGINEKVFLTHEVDIEEMAEYAQDDAIWPLRLRQYELEHFRKSDGNKKLWEIYREVEEPFIHVLAEMEEWGVEIDAEMLEEMRDRMEAELDDIYRQIYEARPGQDFPPVDPDVVREAVSRYADLERRYQYDKDHEEYPDHAEYPDSSRNSGPVGKGWARNYIFKDLGIKGHPVETKIRDAFDKTAPMDDHLLQWPELAHKIFNINSNKDLNKVLFDEAQLVPYGDKTANDLWPTSKDYVEKWAKKHEVAENLNRLRLVSKLKSTYAEGILYRIADDGRLRTNFNRIVRTGRLSSRDPNLQNQPKEDDYPIRQAFVAKGVSEGEIDVLATDEHGDPSKLEVHNDGGGYTIEDGYVTGWWGDNPPWVLGVGDYSQLEIRILAHSSQDETLLETIRNGIDVHGKTAKMMFPDEIPDDVHPDDVKEKYPKQRDNVKPVEFGTIYGIGPGKLSKQLGIPKSREDAGPNERSAEEIIETFTHEIYPGVGEWIDEMHRFARSHGFVYTDMGRKRHIPLALIPDTYENREQLWRAERIAQNSPIQGTAADIINKAMVDIRADARARSPLEAGAEFMKPQTPVQHTKDFHAPLWGEWMKMLLQIHDELVFEFHPAVANWGMAWSVHRMERAVDLDVDLKVDAALGADWHRTKE